MSHLNPINTIFKYTNSIFYKITNNVLAYFAMLSRYVKSIGKFEISNSEAFTCRSYVIEEMKKYC